MSPKITLDQPASYCIRVQGKLNEHWAEFFEGMVIHHETISDGTEFTILTGKLPDQAAVQGTLQKLYNLGFALVSVETLPKD